MTTPGTRPLANLRLPAARWMRYGLLVLLTIVLFALGVGAFLWNRFVLNHNFHVVSPGQVYRCGQLDVPDLTRVVQEHGIKSILNLRGGARTGLTEWYRAETNAAWQLGVRYYDYELSASQELTEAQLDKIVNIMATAPKPLLIHCKSGADRTGLVGALYLYSFEGKPAKVADRELTMFYGHLPFFQDTGAMDDSFWRYVGHHAPASAATRQEKPAASPTPRS
ncbi:MAG TPA: dual specificity protein phosphatase family protein [Verrucomicrobiae bacterium]|nr:dual specificity protein phosphatase family protein [Verrucomicrobiae bacterium]